ncbi:MAG TPA: hypothetical protein VF829_00090 [Candidatus Paceibacterota bacterium]
MLTQRELWLQGLPESTSAAGIGALRSKHPWISRYVPDTRPILWAFEERATPALLDYRSRGTGADAHRGFGETMWLVNKHGKLVIFDEEERVQKPQEEYPRRFLWFFLVFRMLVLGTRKIRGIVQTGEYVEAVVRRIGAKADSVRYVLSYDTATKAAIVYTVPKRMLRWLKEETSRTEDTFLSHLAEQRILEID